MEIDERALQRKQLITYPEVVDRKTNRLIGRVVDITTHGMRLVGSKAVPEKTRKKLKLILPANNLGVDEISFEAESVWSGPDINPDFVDTGFRFTRLDQRSEGVLAVLMRRAAFRN
jgi:hypothetical protein